MRILFKLREKHGFPVLIAIWPAFTEAAIINRPHLFHNQNVDGPMHVETVAKKWLLPTVRLSRYFIENDRNVRSGLSPKAFYAKDEMHPTKEGARLAAKYLTKILEERYSNILE